MPLTSRTHPQLSFLEPWGDYGLTRVRVATADITNGSPATLVAAVSGQIIRVVAAVFSCNTNNLAIDFLSDTTNIGALEIRSGVAIVWPYNPLGWLETTAGEALNVENSEVAASFIRGVLNYVTVAVLPNAVFTGDPTSGDAPLDVTFTDASTGAPTSWAWDFGDGETSTDQNPVHTYATAGTFTVILVAENRRGRDSQIRVDYITAT